MNNLSHLSSDQQLHTESGDLRHAVHLSYVAIVARLNFILGGLLGSIGCSLELWVALLMFVTQVFVRPLIAL